MKHQTPNLKLPFAVCRLMWKTCGLVSLIRPVNFFSLYVLIFPIQTTWCSQGNLPFVFSQIMHTKYANYSINYANYAYIRGQDDIWRKQFSGVPSRGLKWENTTYKVQDQLNVIKLTSIKINKAVKKTRVVHSTCSIRSSKCVTSANKMRSIAPSMGIQPDKRKKRKRSWNCMRAWEN